MVARFAALIAFWAFHELISKINPSAAAGGQPYVYYFQVCHSVETVVFGLAGAVLGRLIATRMGHV